MLVACSKLSSLNSDEESLHRIVNNQVDELRGVLGQGNYSAASRCWNLLKELRIIGHETSNELIETYATQRMHHHTMVYVSLFDKYAALENLTEAERLLVSLRTLDEHFSDENLVDLDILGTTLDQARARHAAQ